MVNNLFAVVATRFALLALLQILIFNQLNFMGFINPMVYLLFLYWYPLKQDRSVFMLAAFALGLLIDIFTDTLALHAIASLCTAFVRPYMLRFCFGSNYEFQGFSYANTTRVQRATLIVFITTFHHLLFFSLEIFDFSHFLLILRNIFFTGLATIVLCLLFASLFEREK